MEQTQEAKSGAVAEVGQAFVNVEVNSTTVSVHRGSRPVAEVKQAASCPLAFELEQIVGDSLVPLGDDERVHIKGGERFICHPRDGASS